MRRNIHQANRQGDLLQPGLRKEGLRKTQTPDDHQNLHRLRAGIPDPADGSILLFGAMQAAKPAQAACKHLAIWRHVDFAVPDIDRAGRADNEQGKHGAGVKDF